METEQQKHPYSFRRRWIALVCVLTVAVLQTYRNNLHRIEKSSLHWSRTQYDKKRANNSNNSHVQKSESIGQDNERDHGIESKNKSSNRKVRFVSFPHQTWLTKELVGDEATCTWQTESLLIPGVHEYLFGKNRSSLDVIQQAALREGICVPQNDTLRARLHVFSSLEARQCLSSPSSPNIGKILVSGDSYNQQLFIGLADILLADPSNNEITASHMRQKVLTQRMAALQNSTLAPAVVFTCLFHCVGQSYKGQTFADKCSWCLQHGEHSHLSQTSSNTSNTSAAVVVGASVHVVKANGKAALGVLIDFLTRNPNVLFNTMPAYHLETVPAEYRDKPWHTNNNKFYKALLEWHAKNDRPVLDFYQLTQACAWKNCSADGGHRSRFVNRWKAQLLLNAVCEYMVA